MRAAPAILAGPTWRATTGKDAALLNRDTRLTRAAKASARYGVRGLRSAARWLPVWICLAVLATSARAAIELPVGDTTQPIAVRATTATHWRQGAYEVWVLRGAVQIVQGSTAARGDDAVLLVDRAEAFSGRPSKVIAYLEGLVHVELGRNGNPHAVSGLAAQSLDDRAWLGRFHTTAGIEIAVPLAGGDNAIRPTIFQRGTAARDSEAAGGPPRAPFQPGAVQQAQYSREEVAPPLATPLATPLAPAAPRVQISARGGGRYNPAFTPDPVRNEGITTINSGVRIDVSSVDQLGAISVETDRLVFWTPNLNLADPSGFRAIQSNEGPLEFYMEGNIVFRQGDRVIYADRMYYNVRQNAGVVLNAEMLTPVPQYQGLLRLKAEVLEQVNRQHFEAYNAALTSSRIGVPRYWFSTQNITVDDVQTPLVDPFTNQPLVNPGSGEPQVDHQLLATSQNNFIYVGGVPIFYWPVIATDLTDPTYYLTGIRFRNDRVFGTGVMLDWDLYELLSIANKPPGTKWTLSTDYLSLRGPALGTSYSYEGASMWGLPGAYRGMIDAWGIHDDGTDNLGLGWRDLPVPDPLRGRVLARHRQSLPNNFVLSAELGLISDYNFLNQYYELEWDTFKDQSTGLQLKQLVENNSWSISADVRPNDFVTDTQWLPRGDHYILGQSLLFDRLTWHAHTSVGYAQMKEAAPPAAAAQLAVISPLRWEADVQGVRAATRHELDLPLELGPAKVVPYILGEVAHWGEDLSGQELTRGYLQTGVKASVPLWRADPNVSSELFNLNGLAHKITFQTEAFYADASEDLTNLPLYDQLDDNANEFTRRQMAVRTFGQPQGTFVPLQFDERLYALRSNLQGSVSSPTEIADDLMEIRLGINQRWQTKRGLPGQQRIIDWMVFDIGAVLFPDPSRDNFDSAIGLIDYTYRWHLGDRLTILSDGFFDFFDEGLHQVTTGVLSSRPEYGSVYIGYRSTEGPISSSILVGSLSYRLSEKWIATAGATYDFGGAGNLGQNLALTRIGESTFLQIGFNYDPTRNNVGVTIGIEPRFLPSNRLGRVGGVSVPPAGAMGLE